MTAIAFSLVWLIIVSLIAIVIALWYLLDGFIRLLQSIRNLAALYFPAEVNEQTEKPGELKRYKIDEMRTSVTVREPLEWSDVDEQGRPSVPRD